PYSFHSKSRAESGCAGIAGQVLRDFEEFVERRAGWGCDYLCRSPNRAKRMECVQLAAAFAALRPIQTFGHSRKRQQAARTPYASRGSVTDTNNRAPK